MAKLEAKKKTIAKVEKPKEVKPIVPTKVVVPKPKPPVPPKVKETPKAEPITKTVELKYDASIEKAVKGLIYSDGKTFCFQVSSWKRENIAKQEVARIKKKGHDAFYVKANIPGKGTWYRVRVGYFNSIAEAQTQQGKVK